MNIIEIIAKKRDGEKLTPEEILFFVNGVTNNSLPDYQISALLMAVYINGMSSEETAALTSSMLNSGGVISFDDESKNYIDKHSTGGVGDKTTFLIAAICGCFNMKIPMIAGRGLGHTGGTLDKLESIPGFNVNLTVEKFKKQVSEFGLSIIGQTSEIAPADKKLYALRDVTSTVASIPLITGSIMSKKLAEGIDSLVLDVKVGSGAFMKNIDGARALARSLVETGKIVGKNVFALITDMNQPLGKFVGNSMEIVECIEILKKNNCALSDDLIEVSKELCARMMILSGVCTTKTEAFTMIDEKVSSGEAFAKFKELIKIQGGDINYLDNTNLFEKAKKSYEVKSTKSGYIKTINALDVGEAGVLVGAGRLNLNSKIDYSAGVEINKKIGDQVTEGELVLKLYYNNEDHIDRVKDKLENSFEVNEQPVEKPKAVLEEIN